MCKFFPVVFVIVIVIFCAFLPAFGSGGSLPDGGGGEIDIEIFTGPEFSSDDEAKINSCVNGQFTFFPLDLLFNGPDIPLGSSECPTVAFFGYSQDLCWALELYKSISPFITFGLIVYAVFHL